MAKMFLVCSVWSTLLRWSGAFSRISFALASSVSTLIFLKVSTAFLLFLLVSSGFLFSSSIALRHSRCKPCTVSAIRRSSRTCAIIAQIACAISASLFPSELGAVSRSCIFEFTAIF